MKANPISRPGTSRAIVLLGSCHNDTQLKVIFEFRGYSRGYQDSLDSITL